MVSSIDLRDKDVVEKGSCLVFLFCFFISLLDRIAAHHETYWPPVPIGLDHNVLAFLYK